MLLKKFKILLLVGLIAILALSATNSSIPGLHHYVLDNGLEVFVFENHIVPLARVQITFRCGAIAQTPTTAGLFHLYEHMLFKGNKVYKNQTAFSAALKQLGITTWNGGTSREYVTYYFTVPSDKIEKGIEFWANAVRFPLFNKDELEAEKKVVLNEIKGYHADPAQIFFSKVDYTLFYKYPWRKDVSGPEKNIENATVEILKQIQKTYYIPNNAALFIGGDVNPQKVLEYVKRYFGTWEKAPDPWANPRPAHPFLNSEKHLIYPDSTFYKNFAFVIIKFRGPDVTVDPEATYAADVWGNLIGDPSGKFKKSLEKKIPEIYSTDYTGMYYYTQRDGGEIIFYTYLQLGSNTNIIEVTNRLKKAVIDELKKMVNDPNYFSKNDYAIAIRKLEDNQLIDMEVASNFLNTISFWWASASTDYYFNYINNCKKVKYENIKNFLNKYILTKFPVVAIRMHKKDFEAQKPNIDKSDYVVITKDNAFWYSPDFNK